MGRSNKKRVHRLPAPPTGPPPVPENPVQFLDDLLVEQGDERIKETIRRVMSPLAAEREFEDLAQEVEGRRKTARTMTNLVLTKLAAAVRMADALSEGSTIASIGRTAKVVMTRMGQEMQSLLETLADLLQDTTSIMLHGLQRRINHMTNMFYLTAGVVDDRNDAMQQWLLPLQEAIQELQGQVADLEGKARDRAIKSEAELLDMKDQIQNMKLRRLLAEQMASASRGRSPGMGQDMPAGPNSRASSRAQSQERLLQAKARHDYAEAVRQAQKLATLSAIDDETHPLRPVAMELWENDHGVPFEP